MKRKLRVLALALLAPVAWASEPRPVTEPFRYVEDFESGELKSWAEYPPAQDVAWDPTLIPTSSPALGHYALERSFQPVRPGQASFGVLKRISFLISASSRLRFAYYVHAYSPPQSLHVVLCGADGLRYAYSIASPARDAWREADLSLDQFRAAGAAPPTGLEVQAVHWELELPIALPADRYLLYLDNVEFTSERPAQPEVTSPNLLRVPERQMALALPHYVSGNTVPVALRIADAATISALVRDPAGRDVARSMLQRDSAGAWVNPALLRVGPDTARGVWTIEVAASTADGRSARTEFEFLVTGGWPRDVHPRLYFGPDDRARLSQRISQPLFSSEWQEIETTARQLRHNVNIRAGREFVHLASNPSFEGFRPYSQTLRDVASLVQANALVFWLKGDDEAGKAAREALLEACRWPTWTLPWFTLHGRHTYYPVGMFAAALAFGYDLLYDQLTPEERAEVRRAMLDKAVIPAYREYYFNNQILFPTSNWISHIAGGSLIGLLAVMETADEAEPYFSALLKLLREHWQATYLPDGSYGEGIDYQRYDLVTTTPLLAALSRVLQVDLAQRYHIAGSYLYPLYAFLPPDRYLDFGDTADRLGALTPWVWLTTESRDVHLEWYYRQYLAQLGMLDDDSRFRSALFNFLWYDPQLTARSPADLPPSRQFPDKGGAILRSGWSDDALVLNFTAGPFFNHNHLDQGSFWLAAFGDILLSEAGITEYYSDDFYRPYFTQSIGHNVLLVDGDPASQEVADQRSSVAALNRWPRITTALLAPVHDQVRADLKAVYPALTAFERTIMFVKPGYLVLFDRVQSDAPHRYSELFHAPFGGHLTLDGTEAWVRTPRARLWMKFLTPGDLRLDKRPGHIPLRDILKLESRPLRERAYLEASTTQPGPATAFLTVLVPQPANAERLPNIEKIEGASMLGLRVQSGSTLDRIGFSLQEGAALRYQEIVTDARSFRASQQGGTAGVVSFEHGTYFALGNATLLRSSQALSGVREAAGSWYFTGDRESSLELYTESKPTDVGIDGSKLPQTDYSYDAGSHMLKFGLPSGTHRVSLDW